ncbi:hypothetical protein NDN08_007978 [Rhodosorus marinus]|uniref:Uncharacterized protein n=1 Tax=Rhodosorus marinus TaxID=101924 RepID=A0AAV8UZF2_9RHOD|nr:hypothetical protein NDN08_007978 [Rhodosorus marinus]
MEGSCGFVGSFLSGGSVKGAVASRSASSRGEVRMAGSRLQSPDSEGPPALQNFFEVKRAGASDGSRAAGTVKIGTGRGVLKNHEGDLEAAVDAALTKATSTVDGSPAMVHVTMTSDIDAGKLREILSEKLASDVPFLGRTIVKDEAEGVLEIVTLASSDGQKSVVGIVPMSESSGAEAGKQAAQEFAEFHASGSVPFVLYSHTPGSSSDSVRSGIAEVLPGTVSYGGEASSNPEDVSAWSLITRETLYNKDTGGCVAVMSVPGSLSFMLSALLKNWAQPKFQEKLHFMIPKYVNDDKLDLLTAIRLDDWDKFTALIDSGLDINLKWEHKQNQTPLLAAAARVRLEMVKYLLERGAQVEVANDGGWTPLMYTESHDQEDERVKEQLGLLVEAGAK